MSKINLPSIRLDARDDVRFKLHDKAVALWDKTIRAAAEKAGDAAATISILSPIFPDDEACFSVQKLIGALSAAGKRPLTLNINSPGGSYFEGAAMFNLLRDHPNRIVVNVLGEAASAASLVAMAGDTIRMYDGALMMIHSAAGLAMGNKKDMRDLANVLDKVDNVAASVYAARTGNSRERVLQLMESETWMTPEDAIKNGFADEIVKDETKRRKPVTNSSIDQIARRATHGAQGAQLVRSIAGKSGQPDASGKHQPYFFHFPE